MSVRWMVWPAVLFTVLMVVFPFVYTAVLSTQDFVFGQDRKFAGLDNYKRMFTDPEYTNAFKLTFLFFFLSLILQLVLGTWLAFARQPRHMVQGHDPHGLDLTVHAAARRHRHDGDRHSRPVPRCRQLCCWAKPESRHACSWRIPSGRSGRSS